MKKTTFKFNVSIKAMSARFGGTDSSARFARGERHAARQRAERAGRVRPTICRRTSKATLYWAEDDALKGNFAAN